MKICVLGAGAWGTAMAVGAAGRHDVTLWARDTAQVAGMSAARAGGTASPPTMRNAEGSAMPGR